MILLFAFNQNNFAVMGSLDERRSDFVEFLQTAQTNSNRWLIVVLSVKSDVHCLYVSGSIIDDTIENLFRVNIIDLELMQANKTGIL